MICDIPDRVIDALTIRLRYGTAEDDLSACRTALYYWKTTYNKKPLTISALLLSEFDRCDNDVSQGGEPLYVNDGINELMYRGWYIGRPVGKLLRRWLIHSTLNAIYPTDEDYQDGARALKTYLLGRYRPTVFRRLGGRYGDE